MKKILAICAAVTALLSISSCSLFHEEHVDTTVEFVFLDENGETIGLGIENILESTQRLYSTFASEFIEAGALQLDELDNTLFILKDQNGEERAEKNILKIAEKAATKLPDSFYCPVDGTFAVTMGYGTIKTDVVVWKHDYRVVK